MSKAIANPTRLQYLTVCGGLPRPGGERKYNDFTEREKLEIEVVREIVGTSSWFLDKFMGVWRLFPLSEDGVLTVSVKKGEVYTSPTQLLEKIVKGIWSAIGNPTIQQEEDGSLSFYVEHGVWPYVAEEDPCSHVIAVEDRLIDIAHVQGLVEDNLSDLLTWFWTRPEFEIVKMVRDLIAHVDQCGFDGAVTKKLAVMRGFVHPFDSEDRKAAAAIGQYPYDKPDEKQEEKDPEQ